MTYHGPDPPREHHPAEAGASPRQARWSLAVGAAILVILGLTFYGINAKRESQTAANSPAVNTAPALPPRRPQPARRRLQQRPRLRARAGPRRERDNRRRLGSLAGPSALVMVVQELGKLHTQHFIALALMTKHHRAFE